MRKLMINGVHYLWTNLSFSNPNHTWSGSIAVAFPEHDPKAAPTFLIDNNGENPFAGHSWANWLPAPEVEFVDPIDGEPVSWEQTTPLQPCASSHCDSLLTAEYFMDIPGRTIKVWLCDACVSTCETEIDPVPVKH